MRRFFVFFVTVFLCFTSSSYAKVTDDFLPLRDVFSGSSIAWIDDVEQVRVDTDLVSYVFTVGSEDFSANGRVYSLSDKVMLKDFTTYVPSDIVSLSNDISYYQEAVLDSMQSDKDELFPLVALDFDSESLATWKDGMVKVCSWHRYPDSYLPDSEIVTSFGEVWVFTEAEIKNWAKDESYIDSRRLEQLIGLAPKSGYTHVSVMYVSPEFLFRPSADPEINDSKAEIGFGDDVSKAHEAWYNGNMIYSYPSRFPWTRLGYTYDWNPNSDEYGLSEFIIKKDSTVLVEDTYSTDEFIDYLRQAS